MSTLTQNYGQSETRHANSVHAAELADTTQTTTRTVRPSRSTVALDRLLRVATAGCLAIDAFVHADLADTYAEGGGTVNEGTLFRVEAAVASLAALVILVTGRRLSYLIAFAVAASALAVMLVARYVPLGAFGPFPNLSDPVWYPEKLWAAFAEGAAAVASGGGFLLHEMRALDRARRIGLISVRLDEHGGAGRRINGSRLDQYDTKESTS